MHINKLLLSLVGCSTLFSCGPKATVENKDENKGTVSYFVNDKQLVLQAFPKENYLFTGWFKKDNQDNEYRFESNSNPYVVKIDGNTTYQARFEDYSTQLFKFEFDNNNYTYSIFHYYGEDTDTNIIIPVTHFSYPVTKINSGTFQNYKNLKPIDIPNSIKYIESNAFKDSGISSISVHNKDIEISDNFTGWTESQTMYITSDCIKTESTPTQTTWGWTLNKNESNDYYTSSSFGENKPHIVVKD